MATSDFFDGAKIGPPSETNTALRRMLYWMAKAGGSVNIADLTDPTKIGPPAEDNTILRRLLYWEVNGGGGGGGAAAASQAQVNAGAPGTVFVAPDTLLAATTVLHPANNLSDVSDAPTSFANIKQAASTAATGVVQVATQGEVNTGADTLKEVTPATLLASTTTLHPANNLSDVANAATSFSNIKQAASTAATGVVQVATQGEVNTGTDALKEVTPSTLANLALTRGFIKQGNGSNVWSNYEPTQNQHTLYVSQTTGSDTRTSISKYNFFIPYLTLGAARTDASSGDNIVVLDGTFNEKNLGKPGVNWYLNPTITIAYVGVAAQGDSIFGDGNIASTYQVFGKGILSFKNTGATQRTSISEVLNASSNVYIECYSATQDPATSGTDNSIARCGGGTQVFVCDQAVCSVGNPFYTVTLGGGSVNQTISCRTISAAGGQVFFCDSGNQFCHNDYITNCIVGAIVTASATLQFLDLGNITTTDTGIKCAGIQRGFVKRIVGGAGVYGVDITSTTGDQDLYVQSIVVGDRAISNRSTGGTQIVRFDTISSTNPVVMQGDGAISHLSGMIITGSSATGAIQFTNVNAVRKLFVFCPRILTTHGTGPVVAMQGTSATKDTLVIYGGSSLVSNTAATYSVDTIGAQNLRVYGHIATTRIINPTNVTLLCGVVEDSTSVI